MGTQPAEEYQEFFVRDTVFEDNVLPEADYEFNSYRIEKKMRE